MVAWNLPSYSIFFQSEYIRIAQREPSRSIESPTIGALLLQHIPRKMKNRIAIFASSRRQPCRPNVPLYLIDSMATSSLRTPLRLFRLPKYIPGCIIVKKRQVIETIAPSKIINAISLLARSLS